MGERQLIQKLKSGDADACRQLVQRHYAAIYHMLARLTRDSHRAEDLCQDVFAAAWAKIGTFTEKCALGTWLHQIAYRQFLDWTRARKNQATDSLVNELIEHDNPLADALKNERQRSLLAGLDQLEELDRHVLVLRYLQQMRFHEIAVILERPEGTLRWHAKIALQRLRRILEKGQIYDVQRRNQTSARASTSAVAGDSARA
jgi:RNA polymerase sigma-70 factor (ECF subfamily)